MQDRRFRGSLFAATALAATWLGISAVVPDQQASASAGEDGYWQLDTIDSRPAEDLSTQCYKGTVSGGNGSATFTSRTVCSGNWTGTSVSNWTAPPERLVPGDRIQMTLSGRASATDNGITAGVVLSAAFNAERCARAYHAVSLGEISLVSHDPARQSGQATVSALVPAKGWASDVAALGGRLKLNVCATGWQTYYYYRWVPGGSASTQPSSPPGSPPTSSPATTGEATFTNPKMNGMGVDNCATFAGNCGQGGADLFCRNKGYARASRFSLSRMQPTYILGDGRTCNNETCVGLSQVTCIGSGSGPAQTPTGTGIPVTYSRWDSYRPEGGAFVGQPARFAPPRIQRHPNFEVGLYDVYVAIADPGGQTISTWRMHQQLNLGEQEKWGLTFYDRPAPQDVALRRDEIGLQSFSSPVPRHAMVWMKNTDSRHWRAVCFLPTGSGMTVMNTCFHGSHNIVYVPPQDSSQSDQTNGGFTGPARTVFTHNKPPGGGRNPPRATTLNPPGATLVTRVMTYHWNDGHGTQAPGTIALRSASGRIYGPWQASGTPGQGGVPNAYWVATPDMELPAGRYTVIDSDPRSWAQNSESGGAGIAVIDGVTR